MLLQQLDRWDILSFLQLYLKNSLQQGQKKDFTLAITLTMVALWKLMNDKVFKNDTTKFRS